MATVYLSAGHGGSDPGATEYSLKEKDINLNTLLACNEELVRHGVTTVLSRTKDENDPVGEEVREANASGAILAVSFHANAGKGDGYEAFYWSSDSNGKRLAQLGEKYVKAIGQNSRGVKTGNHLYFVSTTKMTAVLFESFFVDNDIDNDIGDTISEQRAFGVAYAKAILEYLGIAYNGSSSGSVTPPSTPPINSGYTGSSIVDYLNSVGKSSDFASRKRYANQYGISNYSGTATQNTQLLNAMRGGCPPVQSASYYRAFNNESIVDGLNSIGVSSSFSNRKLIAKANGITNYSGTVAQNTNLCNLARQGRLKRI